jgi:hypothetical protein
MKRFLFISVFCLAFTCNVMAQDSAASTPATKDDVERYLEATHPLRRCETWSTRWRNPSTSPSMSNS